MENFWPTILIGYQLSKYNKSESNVTLRESEKGQRAKEREKEIARVKKNELIFKM